MSSYTRVLIVGAGPAGLAVGGCLRHHRVPFLLLERNAQVGATWRTH
jgi:indole-3-pyruvate monooxygenase